MQDDSKKRKGQKKGGSVPLAELGFKAKVYYGIETEYRRQRARYKAVKYGAENNKDCFMGRLRFTINVAELSEQELETLASFKGIKKNEWNKARHIIYHSKQELHCAICLQKQFQAPQMTNCGHVFCWHCILMHFYKSLKASSCPVCNESYEIEQVVSCQPFFTKSFKELESNKVSFALKARKEGDSRVYNPETLIEDLNFARVVRASPQKILQIFQEQRAEIEQNVKLCEDEQVKKWMQKVYSLSWQRIQKAQALLGKKYAGHSHHRDHKSQGYIYSVLDQKQRSSLINFYQQKSGRLIFLHPICDKIIRKSQTLPAKIEQQIIYWQEAEYNIDQLKKYKQISHLTINQEVDLIIVDISKIIRSDLNDVFREELEKFKSRKKEQLERQERQAQRLSVEYEEQKEYLAKLKKMEESQFYDIYVPPPLDVKELSNTTLFPSLIQTKSMPQPQIPSEPVEPKNKSKKKEPKIVLNDGDFPELLIKKEQTPPQETLLETPTQIVSAKSQKPTVIKGAEEDFPSIDNKKKESSQGLKGLKKKLKKKKQKFINVTQMFFKQEEEEDQNY